MPGRVQRGLWVAGVRSICTVTRQQRTARLSFFRSRSLAPTAPGSRSSTAPLLARGVETKLSSPVVWFQSLDCTCFSDGFIRCAQTLVKDVEPSMTSLDYDYPARLEAHAGHGAVAVH